MAAACFKEQPITANYEEKQAVFFRWSCLKVELTRLAGAPASGGRRIRKPVK
jgi:hypothetical protein